MKDIIGKSEQSHFPICSCEAFIKLVEEHLDKNEVPNLTFLSILFGYLEHELTVSRIILSDHSSDSETDKSFQNTTKQTAPDPEVLENKNVEVPFPTLELDVVQGLYEQFVLFMKANVDKSLPEYTTENGCATSPLCKYISDLMWNGLLRSYHKDKAHIQSLFSYFTGRQLDCFGLAFSVVAACQVLKYDDVHLVVSGDHAWVVCGNEEKDMVEVTWHGKGNEDKRGLAVDSGCTYKNWIYYGGKPVICDRWMELVAMLISVNPSIDSHTESEELQMIQHKLLHKLYQKGYMDRYPMALGTFAELQEGQQLGDDSAEVIHMKAVQTVKEIYDDLHIFPYCSQGHFYMRQKRFKEAIASWAKAAQVASKYNYGKDDEEVYKEMIDIANDLIPTSLRGGQLGEDKECYFDVIRFYDGVCLWEEGSSTPILHSWWARYFTLSVSRFPSVVRESYADDPEKQDDGNLLRRSSRSLGSPSINSEASSSSTCEKEDKFTSPKISATGESSCKQPTNEPETKLLLRSHKMKALKDILTSGKKINTQAVGLLLTAQSQVQFVKRRSTVGDYSIEYKRSRKSKDLES
uniref:Menin n=1 Tax=Phallusia mammillata TaxID=59560 RepID=A0A6F9D832_9ASCI|nr:menin-like [Phallusia mammillata]